MSEGTVCISISEYDQLRMAKKIMGKSYVKKLYELSKEYAYIDEVRNEMEYSKRCKLRNELLKLLSQEVFDKYSP
jgi:hypothetical protein